MLNLSKDKFKYTLNKIKEYINKRSSGSTIPVGIQVDYDGDDIPVGWEEVEPIKTWTPKLIGATVNYTRQSGHYIKIGRIVFYSFDIRGNITEVQNPSYSQIEGLPYGGIYQDYAGTLLESYNCLQKSDTSPILSARPGKFLSIQTSESNGTVVNNWKVGNGFYLNGAGFYFTNE